MTILKKVEELYTDLKQDMYRDIAMYMEHEYVVKTPSSLIMGKPVRKDDGDPNGQWNVTAPDAWFVRTAVGVDHISHFIKCMPYPLPFIGWMRELKNKPVKWYKLEQILRRAE